MVEQSRKWPKTVEEYAQMMDESAQRPVRFTSKGDEAVVLFNFFKMTIGLRVQSDADALQMVTRGAYKSVASIRDSYSPSFERFSSSSKVKVEIADRESREEQVPSLAV